MPQTRPVLIAAAAIGVILLWRRRFPGRRNSPFACSLRIGDFARQIFQLRQHLKIRLMSCPRVAVIERVRARAVSSDAKVVSECRCGACRITVDGGPLFTTVCHCSLCRAHNCTAANCAMPFAAVRRAACRLEVDKSRVLGGQSLVSLRDQISDEDCSHFPLIWLKTSAFVRRGRCALCDSALLFDQEMFEPHTMWIVNPWVETAGAVVTAAEFLGGHDADVCWGSRHVPAPVAAFTAKADFGDFFATVPATPNGHTGFTSGGEDGGYPLPCGREQWNDIDWTGYVVDPGKL